LHFLVISHLGFFFSDVPAPRRGELLRQIRETLATKAWI
jgi:hypothetical protein